VKDDRPLEPAPADRGAPAGHLGTTVEAELGAARGRGFAIDLDGRGGVARCLRERHAGRDRERQREQRVHPMIREPSS